MVIIRGGGATTDLAGFDEVELARSVALFPLPVIVGIGHERDKTVLDFIAHTRVKTPTAAAEFLIARNADVLARVLNLSKYIASYGQKMVHGETQRLESYGSMLPSLATMRMDTAKARLGEITAALPLTVRNRLLKARAPLRACSRNAAPGGPSGQGASPLAGQCAGTRIFHNPCRRKGRARCRRHSPRHPHSKPTG